MSSDGIKPVTSALHRLSSSQQCFNYTRVFEIASILQDFKRMKAPVMVFESYMASILHAVSK